MGPRAREQQGERLPSASSVVPAAADRKSLAGQP